jgi:hypothetical protein
MSSVEIVSRIEARRKWSPAEKAALLAEVDARVLAETGGPDQAFGLGWNGTCPAWCWSGVALAKRAPHIP